jgi:DNA repair exonuclease SbcCD nuclease subunit
MIKLLCVADNIDPVVHSISAKERFKGIDIVLAAGDLPMDYYAFITGAINKPLYFIFGNHNLTRYDIYRHKALPDQKPVPPGEDYYRINFGAIHVDGRCIHEKGLLITGFGGSKIYNHGENQYSDFQMYLKVIRMIPRFFYNKIRYGRYVDIVLTHASAKGINDGKDACHQGFKAFLWLMRAFKPKYLIHGHVHLWDLNAPRISEYHATKVVNAYNHVVLEI